MLFKHGSLERKKEKEKERTDRHKEQSHKLNQPEKLSNLKKRNDLVCAYQQLTYNLIFFSENSFHHKLLGLHY